MTDEQRASDDRQSFDVRYVPFLHAAEDRHFWFQARNAVITAIVRQVEAELPAKYRVLEIGCGTGNTLRVLERVCARGRILGIDRQLSGLVHARARVSCPLVQADVDRPPFPASVRFDLIGMFDVLEHLDDDRRVLERLRAWIAPRGALILTVPCGPELWSAFDVAAHHRKRYSPADLAQVLADAGFRVDYLSPFMRALYPLAWLRRRLLPALRRHRTESDPVLTDLHIVPVANRLLAWLLSREAVNIGSRRRLRFGTSLIAVARP
jgi:SAM-dependent methyltransferase